jgi:hypothetical protein
MNSIRNNYEHINAKLHEINSTREKTPEEYPQIWKKWAEDVTGPERASREVAVEDLQQCLRLMSSELSLFDKGLSSLPSELPPFLKKIDVSSNNLSELPVLPTGLQHLNISNNEFTELPELPSTLEYLSANANTLKEIPSLPIGLKYLSVRLNGLKELPVLPCSLEHLDVSYNWLEEFPALPSNLTHLDAYNNNLTKLPKLPSSLKHLSVGNNKISNLPTLPESMIYLHASANNLANEIKLPAKLKFLDLSDNENIMLPDMGKLLNPEYDASKWKWIRSIPTAFRGIAIDMNWNNKLPLKERNYTLEYMKIPGAPEYLEPEKTTIHVRPLGRYLHPLIECSDFSGKKNTILRNKMTSEVLDKRLMNDFNIEKIPPCTSELIAPFLTPHPSEGVKIEDIQSAYFKKRIATMDIDFSTLPDGDSMSDFISE